LIVQGPNVRVLNVHSSMCESRTFVVNSVAKKNP
jgi:hypothetical protein